MHEFTRFLIVGMQRSGTTVTHHCLGGHPQIALMTDEVSVDPFFTKGMSVFTTGRETFDARCRGYLRLFDAIATAAVDRAVRAAGLKVALGTPEDAADLVECLQEHFPDIKVVMVRRNDLVAQCGSLRRAMRTGQWHAFGKNSGRSGDKFAIPEDEFDDYMRGCRRIEAQLDRLKASHAVFELQYERDIAPGMDKYRLFDFVGVERTAVTWMEMEKVSPPADEFITNYQALVARQADAPPVQPEAAEAEALARDGTRAAKEQSFLLVYRAEARIRRGRLPAAESDVTELLKRSDALEPWIAGRVVGMALVLVERGCRIHRGQTEALSKIHANDASFRLHRADVAIQADMPAIAIEDLRHATLDSECKPVNHDWAAWLIEQALQRRNDHDADREFAARLAMRHSSSAPFLFVAALIANKAGRVDDARQLLVRALAADPGHGRSKSLLSNLAS